MKLLAGYTTDVGRVREGNEDSLIVDENLALFAVADGMGGHLGGEVASQTAIEALRAAISSGASISDAVRRANAAVFERAGADESLYGMGTTLTAIVPAGASEVLIGHVGDSRAYLLRNTELSRLTEDHSLVEELVREGRITEEQAAVHPQRHIITRTVGVEPDVEVDLYTVEVDVDDRILICSDGLTTMVDEPRVQQILQDVPDPKAAAEQLVDAALEAGGTDNITVVVIDVRELGDELAVEAHGHVDEAPAPVPADGDDPTAVLRRAENDVGNAFDAPAVEALDAADFVDVRPSRPRRFGRALFWTFVTLAPIAAIAGISYVVISNDTGNPSTSVPSSAVTTSSVNVSTTTPTTVATITTVVDQGTTTG